VSNVNSRDLVLGVDVGGMHTRVLVSTMRGREIARATGDGGNPTSNGTEVAIGAIGDALRTALSGIRPALVAHGVIGIAGAPGNGDFETRLGEVWTAAGLRCPVDVVSDVDVAFAAGTHETTGALVLAGTGTVIAGFEQGRIARQIDGHGWLVGDAGSGFWLGREAVQAVLRALDGRGPSTALLPMVAEALDVEPTASSIVSRVYEQPPIGLARFAPLVSTAATDGDPVARSIATRATAAILEAVTALDIPAAGYRVAVLAGGVLLNQGPVRTRVQDELAASFGLQVCEARDPPLGAVNLALRRIAERRGP
jgi:N-acetylglucosamine kinase-like BadF-type ATPase